MPRPPASCKHPIRGGSVAIGTAESRLVKLRRGLLTATLGMSLAILAGCQSANFPSLTLSSLFTPNPAADTFPPSLNEIVAAPESPGKATMEAAATRPPALARFRNMTASGVVALVGEPDFRRVEPPAEVWQYRGAACVVDLFLYHTGDDLRVIDEDGRDRDPKHQTPAHCRDGGDVLQARLRTQGS
jgi:hypothetical protein